MVSTTKYYPLCDEMSTDSHGTFWLPRVMSDVPIEWRQNKPRAVYISIPYAYSVVFPGACVRYCPLPVLSWPSWARGRWGQPGAGSAGLGALGVCWLVCLLPSSIQPLEAAYRAARMPL